MQAKVTCLDRELRLPVYRVAQFVPFKQELKGRIKILKSKTKPAEAVERFETWRAHLPFSHTYSNFPKYPLCCSLAQAKLSSQVLSVSVINF